MAKDDYTQLQKDFRSARRVSTPLMLVRTVDGRETARNLTAAAADDHPMIWWDTATGLSTLNRAVGAKALMEALRPKDEDSEPMRPEDVTSPVDALGVATRLPRNSVLVMHNAHLFLIPGQASYPLMVQSIWNLRDEFKTNKRLLVLLTQTTQLPPELVQDFMIFEEELPNRERLEKVVVDIHTSANVQAPGKKTLSAAVDALRGLAHNPAEQITAMSLFMNEEKKVVFDIQGLWRRKRELINQTKGLSVDAPKVTFKDIGGQEQIQLFGTRIFNGPAAPNLVVRIDEIEKMLAGASGPAADTSGVSQDALGVVLREMEDNGWPGMLLVGSPGTGKTLYSTALGTTFEKLSIALDLGAMKGKYVGESEGAIRNAMSVLHSVSDNQLLIIGTCNKLDVLPPELRRRFKLGIWFIDLPTAAERDMIWKINLAKFGLDAEQQRPDDGLYTGADIRNICEIAWRLSCDVVEASKFIVPVAVSDPSSIARLRNQAHNKYLSAAYPGPYVIPVGQAPEEVEAEAGKREISLDLTGGKKYGN